MGDKIIARTILPGSSTFYIALSRIFGIGRPTALNISEACGISQDMKVIFIFQASPSRV
jgi:ribosomal protein S13